MLVVCKIKTDAKLSKKVPREYFLGHPLGWEKYALIYDYLLVLPSFDNTFDQNVQIVNNLQYPSLFVAFFQGLIADLSNYANTSINNSCL